MIPQPSSKNSNVLGIPHRAYHTPFMVVPFKDSMIFPQIDQNIFSMDYLKEWGETRKDFGVS